MSWAWRRLSLRQPPGREVALLDSRVRWFSLICSMDLSDRISIVKRTKPIRRRPRFLFVLAVFVTTLLGCQAGAVTMLTDTNRSESLNVGAASSKDVKDSRVVVLEFSSREWTALVAHDAFYSG